MKIVPLTALMVLACSAGQPTTSSDSSAALGSSAEALRKLGQRDANDVDQCRALAARCSANVDSGSSVGCARIDQLCDALEEQLEDDRAELEACLRASAACEQNASDPAECEDARAACEPHDDQFRARRGRTMQCSSRAEQCLGRSNGFDRRGGDDAGAQTCDDDAVDFVGCCHGKHGGNADAGANGVGNRLGRAPGSGFGLPRDGDDFGKSDRSDDADAGQPERRF